VEVFSWEVWGGCKVVVACSGGDGQAARGAVAAVIAAYDRAASRFRADSELTLLNQRAGRPVAVSPLLFEAVEVAVSAARLTDGAVDPTVGRALEALGYTRSHPALVDQPAAAGSPRPAGRFREVVLDRSRLTVTVPSGVALDLGATAKALAVDRGAAAAQRACGSPVLVGIGGDLAVAGNRPEGWPVRVCEDHREPFAAGSQPLRLHAGGLATSSTTVRRWQGGGRELHHLIDPRRGLPLAGPWRTASVCAASCLQANVLSTAALIWGAGAVSRLRAFAVPARLVDRRGETVTVGAWPKEGRR